MQRCQLRQLCRGQRECRCRAACDLEELISREDQYTACRMVCKSKSTAMRCNVMRLNCVLPSRVARCLLFIEGRRGDKLHLHQFAVPYEDFDSCLERGLMIGMSCCDVAAVRLTGRSSIDHRSIASHEQMLSRLRFYDLLCRMTYYMVSSMTQVIYIALLPGVMACCQSRPAPCSPRD